MTLAGSITLRDGWNVIDSQQSFAALTERLEAAVKAAGTVIVTSASRLVILMEKQPSERSVVNSIMYFAKISERVMAAK